MSTRAGAVTPTTSHWGAFGVRQDADGTVRAVPHPADPSPSPLLHGVPGSLRHPTRIRRPAARLGWLEHGPGPTERRGEEPFVELDWDEALDLAAAELARVRAEHGNQAVFGGSYGWASAGRFHHAQSQLHRFLAGFGGYTGSRNSYSLGTSLVLLPHLVGDADTVLRSSSTWPTITAHTELIIAFGGIPAKNVHVTPGGVTRHGTPGHLAALAAAGTAVALVSPLRDDLPDGLDTDWYALRPATDTALMLGLCHTLVEEGRYDRDFLDRYCSGGEDFLRYLRGADDDIPKDADWAAALTGITADRIRGLARRAARHRTLVTVTWSLQRIQHGEQPVWAGLALAALLGQIGLPGGGFGHGYGSMGDVGDTGPQHRLPYLPQGPNPVDEFIPCARIADLLLHPGASYTYDGADRTYPDIRLVHWAGGNPFHHHQNLGRLRRAFGRPDTVLVHETHWTSTARHADLVFPATTSLERDDIGAGRRDTHLIAMHRAVEPVGEARDDHAVLAALAERLGFGAEFTENRSPAQWLRHLYTPWAAELAASGTANPPSFDDFWAAGEWQLPEQPAERTLFAGFRADPEGSPLDTPSGRIELSSKTLTAFELPDCPGHPAWLEPDEWHGSPTAARFPLLLIANQPATRLHSQLDVGAPSLAAKVAGREAVQIHPADAAARGIHDGDLVRLFNDRGACLAGATLSDRIRPGVLRLPTGAWFSPVPGLDPPLCAHGNPNVLTADIPSSHLSQGATGQHALVQAELWTDGAPPPVTTRQPPPFASRPPKKAGTPNPAENGTRMGQPETTTPEAPAPDDRAPRLRAPDLADLADLDAVTETLARHAPTHDRDATLPLEGLAAAHTAGLLTATVSPRYGGPGHGLTTTTRVLRALGGGDPAAALIAAMTLFTHAAQARTPAWPDAVYQEVLAESAGRATLVNALRVEPDLGSPVRGGLPATTARRRNGDWYLTGHKIFSTGAPALRWMAVWARTDETPTRVGSFLVRADTPGIEIRPTWNHLGLRASRSDDVLFDDVLVPAEQVAGLAEPGADGGRDVIGGAWNSLGLTALYLGVARTAQHWLTGYLHERVPSALGAPLASLPRFQTAVGEIEVRLAAAERLVNALATAVDDGDEAAAAEAGGAKVLGTRAAITSVEEAVALIGNNGLTQNNPLQRHLRDVLCSRVHTPQDDSVLLATGRSALDA